MDIIVSIIIGVLGIILLIILTIRNQIVFKARIKALEIIGDKSTDLVDKGQEWRHLYEEYNNYQPYNIMLIDIRKWKFDDFFPGIRDL